MLYHLNCFCLSVLEGTYEAIPWLYSLKCSCCDPDSFRLHFDSEEVITLHSHQELLHIVKVLYNTLSGDNQKAKGQPHQ